MTKRKAGVGALALAALLLTCCQRADMEIVYVFPEGFRGVAKIRSRRPEGLALRPQREGANRQVLTLQFPASGVLDIRGESPTLDWYSPSARYADGTAIPVAGFGGKVAEDAVALRGMGGIINDEEWYVVGTFADQLKAAAERHAYKYPD